MACCRVLMHLMRCYAAGGGRTAGAPRIAVLLGGMVGSHGDDALLAFVVGRWRGGRGELADSVILVAWLQFIQLLIVVVQLVVLVALPVLAPIVEVGAVLIFLWLLVNFVAEMHGFRSLGMVFLGIVLTFVLAVFGMTILLMLIGVAP